MLRKSQMAYVAEDNGFDYTEFVEYCHANYPGHIWMVFDGIIYCYADSEAFLVAEYADFLAKCEQYNFVTGE